MLNLVTKRKARTSSKKRRKALRGFDRFARRARLNLQAHYGADFAESILADARVWLDVLATELPYIGGLRNVFTPVMIVNSWGIALHRAMKARVRRLPTP